MKIKLAVIFGGKSVEHEISIISALQAMNNINEEKYEIFPIYLTKSNEFYFEPKLRDISEYKGIPGLLKKRERIVVVTESTKTYCAL
jgi:D-alanine-D-alanine ligase